jgi:hypothetical protein
LHRITTWRCLLNWRNASTSPFSTSKVEAILSLHAQIICANQSANQKTGKNILPVCCKHYDVFKPVKRQRCKNVTLSIVIYKMSARRHFSRMNALFEARATKERVLHLRECAEYVFSHRSSCNFLKRTLSDWSYTLCE